MSCGLCCDGSLIGFVELGGEELAKLRVLMDIEEFEVSGFFLLPCKNIGCDGCKIYSQRPKKCREFECGLLKSIEKEELDFNSALEVVRVFKQKKIALEKQFDTLPFKLASPSFYFKVLELRKLMREDNAKLTRYMNLVGLLSDLEELNRLASMSFSISYF